MRNGGAMMVVLAVLLAGCAGPDVGGTDTQVAAGGWRSEPVIYNGRRYVVDFRVMNARERLARVRAPGRKLGATPGDGRIVAQIASSTVGHFTCRGDGRARVRPASLRADGGQWTMVVVCG